MHLNEARKEQAHCISRKGIVRVLRRKETRFLENNIKKCKFGQAIKYVFGYNKVRWAENKFRCLDVQTRKQL